MRMLVMLGLIACAGELAISAEAGAVELAMRLIGAANRSDGAALLECFSDQATVRIVSMEFKGKKDILGFFQRDVWGGTYTVEKTVERPYGIDLYLQFQPKGWDRPEPPILYRLHIKNGQIQLLEGVYRPVTDVSPQAPFQRFLAAVAAQDTGAISACFSADALVIDVGRRIQGRDRIHDWARDEIVAERLVYSVESFKVDKDEGTYLIHIKGKSFQFKARYRISVRNNAITKAVLEYAD